MKTFLKICKWLGITAVAAVAGCVLYSSGVAKGKDMTIPEYWQSQIEKPAEKPENEENQDIVDVPEIEDENTAE